MDTKNTSLYAVSALFVFEECDNHISAYNLRLTNVTASSDKEAEESGIKKMQEVEPILLRFKVFLKCVVPYKSE